MKYHSLHRNLTTDLADVAGHSRPRTKSKKYLKTLQHIFKGTSFDFKAEK